MATYTSAQDYIDQNIAPGLGTLNPLTSRRSKSPSA